MAVSGFRLRARLDFSIPPCFPGQRGITPAFGYGAPHPSAEGTSTPLTHALPSTHCEPLRHPRAPGLSLTGVRLIIPDHALGLPVLRALSLCTCCRQYPGAANWASSSLISPSRISLPRNCSRVGLHIVLFEACAAYRGRDAHCWAPRTDPDRPDLGIRLLPRVFDVKAHVGPRVKDARLGKPDIDELRHTLPCEAVLLAAPPERSSPEVGHVVPER